MNENIPPDKATALVGIQSTEDSFVSIMLLAIAFSIVFLFEIPALFPDVNWTASVIFVAQSIGVVLLIVLAFSVSAWMAIFSGMFGGNAKRLVEDMFDRVRSMFGRATQDWRHAFRSGRKYLFASTTLALIQWSARHSIALLIIGFVGGQMMPMLHWVLQCLVITAGSIIPTPGGAGGTEASFLLFFSPFVAEPLLGPAMVFWRGVIFYLPVAIAALIFLMAGWFRPISRIKNGPD